MSAKKQKKESPKESKVEEKAAAGVSTMLALHRFFVLLVRLDDFILGISYAILAIVLLNTGNVIIVDPAYRIYLDWILIAVLLFLGFIITSGILIRGIRVEFRTTVLFLLLVDGSLATIGFRYDVLFGVPELKNIMLSAATILLVASIALVLSVARQVITITKLAKESQEFIKAQQRLFQSLEKAGISESAKKMIVKSFYDTQSYMSLVFTSVAEPLGEDEINKQMLVALLIAIVSAFIQYLISPYATIDYSSAIGYEIAILFVALIAAWFWTNRKVSQLKAFKTQIDIAKRVAESL